MQLVDNNTFLQQLGALFESTKDKGTIWLTYKRLTHDGDDTVMKEGDGSDGSREYPCIVRVTDGKKVKFSTKILSIDLDKFHSAYGALLKSSMTTLRKRDKKREKQRAEQLAKRKQRIAEPVVIDGPKRGNGRRKRQRQVKAALKHADMKERVAKREEARAKS
ncbi:signal recognition particle, SRP9/SRP14 subunit [Suillus bovinus]|uniref:signal recognition particle, SRP9/SRP14 subunit n=1 Tax=Suillus bovinus TaxID=48563 RepID=UPI001B875FDA|nr:signal recognition particle, SRP9/SRP14 subunit [Suillus bovinus]KAG2144638.1 signal recognition particle, SRP9/SRP14 subunit [Suillus bovinus]